MKSVTSQRALLGLLSLATLLLGYTLLSNAGRVVDAGSLPEPLRPLLRPEVIPPTQAIAEALVALVAGPGEQPPAGEGHIHAGHGHHAGDHVDVLLQQGVTLQASIAITTA